VLLRLGQPRVAVDGWSFRGGVCSLFDSKRVMLRRRVPRSGQARGSRSPRVAIGVANTALC
jgi:hypothetical protein